MGIEKDSKNKIIKSSYGRIYKNNVDINKIYHAISRVCWRSSTELIVIIKDRYNLELQLKGVACTNYFKFEKKDMACREDVDKFIEKAKSLGAYKAFFIVTGFFSRDVAVKKHLYYLKHISLEDGESFFRGGNMVYTSDLYKYIPK